MFLKIEGFDAVIDKKKKKEKHLKSHTLKDRYLEAQRVRFTTLLQQQSLYLKLFPAVKQKSTCMHTQEKYSQRYPSFKET